MWGTLAAADGLLLHSIAFKEELPVKESTVAEGKSIPGGMFAGVGEFPSTVSESAGSEEQRPVMPDFKPKPEAALRQVCVVPHHEL